MDYHVRQARALADGFRLPIHEGSANAPSHDLARWDLVVKDTYLNETIRHRQVHDWLAKQVAVRPDQVKNWLYKEVLHTDLDDPYLGLHKTIFDGYPFDS